MIYNLYSIVYSLVNKLQSIFYKNFLKSTYLKLLKSTYLKSTIHEYINTLYIYRYIYSYYRV